ncbi:MAG: S41 family peptidase [Blastocatellia bacterium]
MKKMMFAALCALMLLTNGWAQNPATPPHVVGVVSATDKPTDLRQQSFDIVWQTVKDKHFDPALGGVNWENVRQQYQPRVAGVKSDAELYRLLQQMLGELRQSHFNIIPPEAIIPDNAKEPPTGSVGIDLRMIDGALVVVRVESGSPAEQAGLRTGFVIKQVGESKVEELIAQITKVESSEKLRHLQATRRVLREINGEPGSSVKLVYLDAKDQPHSATITRAKLKGELSQRIGNFPPHYTELEWKRLPKPGTDAFIGYVRFNIFTMPINAKIRAAFDELKGAEGIVLDLRGNPGGIAGIATFIAGRLSDKSGQLGTMKMRSGEVKFAVFPQQNAYTGPIAILIDGMSASTSEVFSSGMQELGRAVVIGETSAGACLPSVMEKLPTGALFQFAIADFKTPKGILIEGRGVIPDFEVKWNRASLLTGRDTQLETAIERLAPSKQRERSAK